MTETNGLTLREWLEKRFDKNTGALKSPAGSAVLPDEVSRIQIACDGVEVYLVVESERNLETIIKVLNEFYGPFGCEVSDTHPKKGYRKGAADLWIAKDNQALAFANVTFLNEAFLLDVDGMVSRPKMLDRKASTSASAPAAA